MLDYQQFTFWHAFCILIWHEQKHIYANQKFQPIWTVRYQQILKNPADAA